MTLFDLFTALFRRRRWIIGAIATGMILGVLIAIITPSQYRADARVVSSNTLSSTPDLSGLSQLGAAAAELGVNIGTGSGDTSPLFPEILASRDLLTALLARKYPTRDGRQIDLVSALEVEGETPELTNEYTIEQLAQLLRSSYDMKSGATTVSVTLPDPVMAAAVVNAAIEEMNRRIEALRSGQAGGKVRFISERLEDTQKQLGEAESAILGFREKNRQVMSSPQLMLEEARLTRDLTLNEQMFLTLKTQYELARIDQFRNLPDAIVMDRAHPPVEKDSPHRLVLVVAMTMAFGFFGTVAIFAFDKGRQWARTLAARQAPSRA